jgi:predicted GIY-YIG superfamily endonuclease
MNIYQNLYYVYLIKRHPKDGKPYVGCTKDVELRMKGHKVSIDNAEILFETDDIQEASLKEQELQIKYCGKADGCFYSNRARRNFYIDSEKRTPSALQELSDWYPTADFT